MKKYSVTRIWTKSGVDYQTVEVEAEDEDEAQIISWDQMENFNFDEVDWDSEFDYEIEEIDVDENRDESVELTDTVLTESTGGKYA